MHPFQTTFGDLAQAHDEAGILKSRDYFNSLIKTEVERGIPSDRIILGNFNYFLSALAISTDLYKAASPRVAPSLFSPA